jgi:hypothetical protein
MSSLPEFESFQKIARMTRPCTITEKIDGTNGQLLVTAEGQLWVGSRSRWVAGPEGMLGPDNFGFGSWALAHRDELIAGLGIGCHYGEWWGSGIQRGYGLREKRFSLFNTSTWGNDAVRPQCCSVVPVLYQGMFDTLFIQDCITRLTQEGSLAAPGFMNPEGVVIYHTASSTYFKKTLTGDAAPKGAQV